MVVGVRLGLVLSSLPFDSSGRVRVIALDPRSEWAVPGHRAVSQEYGFPGKGGPPPPSTEGTQEGRCARPEAPSRSLLPCPVCQAPSLSSRSHSHFSLAGRVAGMVAGDIVQLLHRVVSARSEGLALGCRLALAQRGIGVIGGTGMGVHLGHAVAVQHGRGHKNVRVRDGPRQGLLRKGRPLRGQQWVLGVQALCGEQLLI